MSDSTPLTEQLRAEARSWDVGANPKAITALLEEAADALAVSEARVASLEEALEAIADASDLVMVKWHGGSYIDPVDNCSDPFCVAVREARTALAAGVVTNGENMSGEQVCETCGGDGWYLDHEDQCYENGDCSCSGIQAECSCQYEPYVESPPFVEAAALVGKEQSDDKS